MNLLSIGSLLKKNLKGTRKDGGIIWTILENPRIR